MSSFLENVDLEIRLKGEEYGGLSEKGDYFSETYSF